MEEPVIHLPHLDRAPRVHPTAYVAPGAIVIGDVEIGEYSSVWFNTVVRGDVNSIRIGARSNIQDMTICHVQREQFTLTLGDEVSVGHGCVLHGCTIGNRVLIGLGARILNGAVIGDDCLIAAGALVTEGCEIPPRSLVVGVPAKVKKPITESQLELIRRTTESYLGYRGEYRRRDPRPLPTPFGVPPS